MKKIYFYAVILVLLMLGLCSVTFAAGSCSQTTTGGAEIYQTEIITFVCTDGASPGSYPALGATGLASQAVRGWVTNIDVWEGSPAPTSGTSFTLIASDTGRDVLGTNGSGAITATPAPLIPPVTGWVNNGTLSPVITGNSVASAVVTIRVTVWKQKN